MISNIMETVSQYISGASTLDMPEYVMEKAKIHLLDTVAAMVSGSALLPGEKAIAFVRQQGGTPEAVVVATGLRVSAVNAALANGMMAHADETDDSHKGSRSHLGCGVVPAALAMAERHRASGEALLKAIVVGYDIGARATMALNVLPFYDAARSTHSFAAIFGASAAASALAGLGPAEVRWALSYTAQQASGVNCWRRDTQHIEKAFDFGGMPARDGVSAAVMVAAGFTGVEDVFSGPRNFFMAYGVDPDPEAMARELGTRFEIMETTVKKWSVGSPAQAVVDGAYNLLREHGFDWRSVEAIDVYMNPVELNTVDNRDMPNISVQHLTAVMLIEGDLGFEASHDYGRMSDPDVLALKAKVTLIPTATAKRRQATLSIRLADGRTLTHVSTGVHGMPGNPMSFDDVARKAEGLIRPILGATRCEELIGAIRTADRLADASALARLLEGPG